MLIHRRLSCVFAITLIGGAELMLPGVACRGQKPAEGVSQASCTQISDSEIPLSTTIQAKVTGLLSAGHLKPGKEIWVKVARGVVFPGCTMETDTSIYGRITAASSSKNPAASEISVKFDRVDCTGHDKKAMKLYLIGVVAPPDDAHNMHDSVPTEVRGGSRQINDAVWGTDGMDARLNPGGSPHTVHPGIVVGIRNLKLEPQGGPECSAKMTSTNRNIELAPDTVLLLAVLGME